MVFKPIPWQSLMLAVPEAYDLLLSGGRGGGKSSALPLLIARDAVRFGAGYKGVVVRKDLLGLGKIIDETQAVVARTPELRDSQWRKSDRTYTFGLGGWLVFHWISDDRAYSRFQGVDITHLYIDESGQMADPKSILKMRSSMRTTDDNVKVRTVLTCNPNNPGSWWHFEHFIKGMTPWLPAFIPLFQKEFVYIHSTLFDNPYIKDKEEYVSQLKASCQFDEAKIQSEVYGSWDRISGSFFSHVFDRTRLELPWPSRKLLERNDVSGEDYWLSLDWGTDKPASLQLYFRAPRQMEWPIPGEGLASFPEILALAEQPIIIGANSVVKIDEYYSALKDEDGQFQWNKGDFTLTTSKMARYAAELCERNGLTLNQIPVQQRIADAAIGSNHGSEDGSIGYQLEQFGAEFSAGPKGLRSNGWTLMVTLMEAAGSPVLPGLYATERCLSFFACTPMLVYDQRNPLDIDSNGPDHTADADRYALMAMQNGGGRMFAGPTVR
jgi:hypothetical protein